MHSLYTGQCPAGFQYVDNFKDVNRKYGLGDCYQDAYGNTLKVVSFYRFETYAEVMKFAKPWRLAAKRINLEKDNNFISRKDKAILAKSAPFAFG